jgi:hypothetical protein
VSGSAYEEQAGAGPRNEPEEIQGCKIQIEALDGLLAKTLPVAGDSRFKKTTKALWSITQDSKVESITRTLLGYITTLTFYHAAASSTFQI